MPQASDRVEALADHIAQLQRQLAEADAALHELSVVNATLRNDLGCAHEDAKRADAALAALRQERDDASMFGLNAHIGRVDADNALAALRARLTLSEREQQQVDFAKNRLLEAYTTCERDLFLIIQRLVGSAAPAPTETDNTQPDLENLT